MGVGDSGIGSQQNVGNCNVFSPYTTAFEKSGLIQKFDISIPVVPSEYRGDGNAVSLPQNNLLVLLVTRLWPGNADPEALPPILPEH